jgi:carboxypeptidase Taq
MNRYQKLEEIYSKVTHLENIIAILDWDVAVNIASNSIESRSEQISELQKTIHEILTSNRLGDSLANIDLNILNPWQLKNCSLITKARDIALISDPDLISSFTKATTISEFKWRAARENNDFKSYLPYLAEVVKLTKEIAKPKALKFKSSLYDALIDNYEPNLSTSIIDPIFVSLEKFLKDFIPEVIDHQKQKSWQVLENKITIPEKVQFRLAKKVMQLLDFDFSRGRVDISTHPQSCGFRDDNRITTRFDQFDITTGLMGVIHETGHAIYTQNLPEKMKSQPVGAAIGMAMHESQSLIMEMQLARSAEFIEFISKEIKDITSINDSCFDTQNLYKKLNKAEASFIRVNADEVTYQAHIIMRYKIEKSIIEDDLPLQDLPGVWADELHNILGIRPKNDNEGVLQDIHWPCGLFGYFPCYSLGAIMAAQLFHTAEVQINSLKDDIAHGNFSRLTSWLNNNIHSQGLLYYSDELLKQVTGEELKLDYYTAYLKNKFLC